ncbi:NAD(P)-dependent oxidoreductase [Burkholderia cenocepacia]|uniref:NAD(P)-dependent oxidoreductase n=1 Tax=Burkholderia cenocepacia TaxID=95486 RepID=UPI00406C949D
MAARGSLADEDMLYDALTYHRLFGAGLRVYRNEPTSTLVFTTLDNVEAMLDGRMAPKALRRITKRRVRLQQQLPCVMNACRSVNGESDIEAAPGA